MLMTMATSHKLFLSVKYFSFWAGRINWPAKPGLPIDPVARCPAPGIGRAPELRCSVLAPAVLPVPCDTDALFACTEPRCCKNGALLNYPKARTICCTLRRIATSGRVIWECGQPPRPRERLNFFSNPSSSQPHRWERTTLKFGFH